MKRLAALLSAAALVTAAGGQQAIARPRAVPALQSAAAGEFAEPVLYQAGIRAWSLAHADFDGDGSIDVATGNGGNSISVFLNTGDGTFRPRTDYPALKLPYFLTFDIVAADFTSDGKPDVAISGGNPVGNVIIYANKGDGTFAAPTAVPIGFGPNQLAAADLDRDGKQDIVTTNNFAADVSVRLGNGDGTFGVERHYEVGPGPQGLRVTDANHDRIPDLLTGNFGRPQDSLSVLYGRGDGTFRKVRQFTAGVSVNDVATGDLNGDGRLDAVLPEFINNRVQVVLGRPGGRFGAPTAYAIGTGVNEAAIADVNLDGRPDIITSVSPDSNRDPGSPPPAPGLKGAGITVLLGNGDGTFAEQKIYSIEGAVAAISPVDVNGDGRTDVIAANLNTNSLVVWLNIAARRG
jgi:hypothetical protein